MKAAVKIKGGVASKGEVLVTNGALHVTLATGTTQEGYGESQIKGGIASKGEAVVTDGFLHIRVS